MEEGLVLVSQFFANLASPPECVELIEMISHGIFICDIQGQFIDANPAACHLLGYVRDDVPSLNIVYTILVRDETFNRATIADFLDGSKGCRSWLLRHKTGVDLFVDVVPKRLPNGCYICVLRDNTERRAAELALRASQQRITLATEATEIGIWEWNVHTDRANWDASMFRMYGIPQTPDMSVTYETWATAVHPEDRERQEQLLRKHAGDWAINRREFRIRRPDGEIRYIEAVETIRRDREGHIEWVVGTNLDITERKNVENSLREREKHLRQFYDSKLLGVFYWNMTGQVLDANDKFLEMLGYNRSDLETGKIDWQNMTPDEFRHLDELSIAELVATGVNSSPFEKAYFRKDGSLLPVLVAGAMLDEARFNGAAFILDISKRRRAEEKSRFLMHEVNHRAKNLLAVVQAMAIQTARGPHNTDFVEVLLSRLKSLAACHELVVNSDWQGVNFKDLVESQLSSFYETDGARIFSTGPSLQLRPDAAQTISMVLHELGTNAVKYGALASPEGQVYFSWGIVKTDQPPTIRMSWKETNGPPVMRDDPNAGYGHKMLINMVEYSLGATVSLNYPPTGCTWECTAPLESICAAPGDEYLATTEAPMSVLP